MNPLVARKKSSYDKNLLKQNGGSQMSSTVQPIKVDKVDGINLHVFDNRYEMGVAAARAVAAKMKELLSQKEQIRMVFAAAPSQNEFLKALIAEDGLDWKRVTAFHMDEYIDLLEDAPQRFSTFLMENLFKHVLPGEVHLIDGLQNPSEECRRYRQLIRSDAVDIICLGIGENGHIAFNDPSFADFQDPEVMKVVKLDEACRKQQVNDGCFKQLDDVPTHALTLTIPTILDAASLFCIVPGEMKQSAVKRTLSESISTDCPASILRTHPNCQMYVDRDSYRRVSDV